ncbi:MAG: CoA transferase [Chloroflexi bacterium]|nr:CoA transferase [Chloroflexota bacterium]
MAKVLDGTKVIEWGQFHQAPAAAVMLGDLGAEVVKVEDPERGDGSRGLAFTHGVSQRLPDGRSPTFEYANRNKRGITLNLKTDKGRKILYELVAKSDVFLHNYHDSVCQRLGTDYETLSKYNPRLVYARASGYGPKGSLADERAFDSSGQAYSGLMWAMGERSYGEPVQAVGMLADQMAATMVAYGVLAALFARERTGKGLKVDASLLGSMMHFQTLGIHVTLLRGRTFAQHSRSRARNPLANHYQCSDGKWIILTEPQSDRYWHEFCEVMHIEHLENKPTCENMRQRRQSGFAEVNRALAEAFATRTRDEWLRLFKERNVGFAHCAVQDYYELIKQPQPWENGYLVKFNHPTLGEIETVGCPLSFSSFETGISREAPQHGQHTEEVLLELGHTWHEIQKLREEKAI